jgi:hypothetical protein
MNYKENDLVKYKWVYSNEEDYVGVIIKIEKDLNFGSILHILGADNSIEAVPQRMLKIERLGNEH